MPALEESLDSKELPVRRGAAKALGWIGQGAQSAIPKLAAALGDENGEVRQQASESLAQIGPAALPALVEAAGGDSALARAGAVRALSLVGPAAQPAAQAPFGACEGKDKEGRAAAIAA